MFRKEDGFTLVEVIVAVVILAIVIIPISMLFVGVRKNTVRTEELLRANEIASAYMENLKAKNIREIEAMLKLPLDYDPDSLSSYIITCDENGNNVNGVQLQTLPRLSGKDKSFRVEIVLSKDKLHSSAKVDKELSDVEAKIAASDARISLADEIKINGVAPDFIWSGDKILNLEFFADKKTCIATIVNSDGDILETFPSINMENEPDEHIIVFDFTKSLGANMTVNVDNKSKEKLNIYVINEEKNESKNRLEIVSKDGWVAVNRGVYEKLNIKSALLSANIKVEKKERNGSFIELLCMDGSITNE